MDVEKDFADLCSLLNAKGVEFVVVGGYAVAFHGAPRFTGDLELLVGPDPHNVSRALDAVKEFGFPTADLSPEYLIDQGKILQMGRVPLQVRVMTSISGVTWAEVWASRESGMYGGAPVFFIGRTTLIANKLASGRIKHRADVEALQRRKL